MEYNDITTIIQKKELSMLLNLQSIMKEINIPFFLACGTALGCVRHQGFIPWDDDVDIYIFGSDYPKLQAAFKSGMYCSSLELHDYTTHKNYPYPFPKIVSKNTYLKEKAVDACDYNCGVFIDVFLLSDVSNNKLLRLIEEKKRYFYYCLLRAYYHKYNGRRSYINKIAKKIVNPIKAHKGLIKCCERTRKQGSYTIDTGAFGKQALLKKESFIGSENMNFCGHLLPVPSGYDTYLTDYYGDYMQLPPEENRVSGHSIESLIIDGETVL
jgi:lipopolysaccharide cholinephosphotransferase